MSAPNFRLRLPATNFPMRQKHAESEPALAARWRTMSHRRPGAAPFVLLDGPPRTGTFIRATCSTSPSRTLMPAPGGWPGMT